MRFKNILHYFILGIFLITCAEPPRKTNALVKTSTVPNANHTEPSKIEATREQRIQCFKNIISDYNKCNVPEN